MNPLEIIASNQSRARDLQDASAAFMTMVTTDPSGCPRSRVVTIRHLDETRIGFTINLKSPKYEDLQRGQGTEFHIFWPRPFVQFRLRGPVDTDQGDHCRRIWGQRPEHGRRADHYHHLQRPQGAVIGSFDQYREEMEALNIPRPERMPPDVALLLMTPDLVEFCDLNPETGIHDRRLYERTPEGPWQVRQLVP